MDNLPNDPPNQNNNNPNSIPPPFGSNFNPHTNPPDPNNPYQPQPQPPTPPPQQSLPPQTPQPSIHSEVAKHRPRDAHGHFLPYEHPTKPNPDLDSQTSSNPSIPTQPEVPTAQVIHNTPSNSSDSKDGDEPLFEAKVNNPFSKFFNWIKRLIKNEGINIKIKPLTAIAIAVALTGGGGIVGYIFPHSSPILHRAVIYQGNIQKTQSGFILALPNSDLYTLRPKQNSSINFNYIQPGQALVKGNLTKEDYVIEVSEIISLNPYPQPAPATNSAQVPP